MQRHLKWSQSVVAGIAKNTITNVLGVPFKQFMCTHIRTFKSREYGLVNASQVWCRTKFVKILTRFFHCKDIMSSNRELFNCLELPRATQRFNLAVTSECTLCSKVALWRTRLPIFLLKWRNLTLGSCDYLQCIKHDWI